MHLYLFLLMSVTIVCTSESVSKPNIVFIIADDLGWNDVSHHGSDQIPTPNIDLLAYSGVALHRYHSHSVCTPSRAALLTGKYAYITGMQGYPLTGGEDRALPMSEKLLPQYFKELGYVTRLVGKWHVGHARKQYLPTNRGFDTHFGHRGGYVDYYEYVLQEKWSSGKVSGLDLYRNLTAAWDVEGYLTDLYTREARTIIESHNTEVPLFLYMAHNAPHCSGDDGVKVQAPPEVVRQMRHVESPDRRVYAAMVKKLDDSVGDIVEALAQKGMLNNTIIVFVSDNGGITAGNSENYASNWPMRGLKMSPFEGGTRVVGLLWSGSRTPASHYWGGHMHVADWLPTLMAAAGADPPHNISGFNLWDEIFENSQSSRKEIFEFDDHFNHFSVISGDYKLITGKLEKYGDYYGEELNGIIGAPPSHIDAIVSSKMYSILSDFGTPFDIDQLKLRSQLELKCRHNLSNNMCFPDSDIGKMCLYNIMQDPCETEDLFESHKELADALFQRIGEERKRLIPRLPLYRDPRSNPGLFNYTWSSWADEIHS